MFSAGDTVYTIEGQEAEYVARISDRHIVQFIYESEGREPHYGKAQEVREVFAEAPVAVYNENVLFLREEINGLRDQLKVMRAEESALKKSAGERMEKLKQHEALALVEHFLAGEIKYFVSVHSYNNSIKIMTFDEFMSDREENGRAPKAMKLLSLFGGSKGDLTWQRSSYSDSSGSGWTQAYPCLTLEDATEKVNELFAFKWESFTSGTEAERPWVFEDAVKSADELGVAVPHALRTAITQYRIDSATKQAEDAERKAEVFRAQANALKESVS